MKIVAALQEHIPGLHIVSNIKLTECKTCINRQKKYDKDVKDLKAANDERVASYASKITITGPERPLENLNQGPISHSCMNHRSFPRLILFQQRISLNLEILKVLPEFSLGYRKPIPPSPIEIQFNVILSDYELEEQDMKRQHN